MGLIQRAASEWHASAVLRVSLLCAVAFIAAGVSEANAAGGVCFEPINSIALPAILQISAALQAKGCGSGDIFVAVIPKQIKAGPSLVAATFCDYRQTVTMLSTESTDNTELSCVLSEPRQARTSR